MSRIYPARNTSSDSDLINEVYCDDIISPRVLTVWNRSSMSFQGTNGFTVFNSEGKLVFRVDNYSKKSRCLMGGIVLMDGAGKAILTLKPQ
ncbi:Lurp-one-related 5-like, partial [Thalictrum thalictroides]